MHRSHTDIVRAGRQRAVLRSRSRCVTAHGTPGIGSCAGCSSPDGRHARRTHYGTSRSRCGPRTGGPAGPIPTANGSRPLQGRHARRPCARRSGARPRMTGGDRSGRAQRRRSPQRRRGTPCTRRSRRPGPGLRLWRIRMRRQSGPARSLERAPRIARGPACGTSCRAMSRSSAYAAWRRLWPDDPNARRRAMDHGTSCMSPDLTRAEGPKGPASTARGRPGARTLPPSGGTNCSRLVRCLTQSEERQRPRSSSTVPRQSQASTESSRTPPRTSSFPWPHPLHFRYRITSATAVADRSVASNFVGAGEVIDGPSMRLQSTFALHAPSIQERWRNARDCLAIIVGNQFAGVSRP